jgi:phosphoglycerol transferase MdoB-like AlkP superfamily enzyme
MESYLTTAGFTHITEDDNFDQSIDNSKWGVADHYVFDRLLQESDSARNPFFKVMLSLSSHEPFEVPMERVIKGNDEQSLFLNSCFYTDKSLGAFIDQAKKTNWWKNTLIIVTADHGHRFPHTEELKDKERFQIPMLWLGGAISKKDTVIQTISGQTDMANTLLSQVGKVEPSYAFSKNILDARVIPFAVYVFNNGFGYIDPVGETIYDFDYKSYIKQDNNAEGILAGKAYMQSLFNDYNSR